MKIAQLFTVKSQDQQESRPHSHIMYTRYQLDPNTREYGAGENIIKEEKKRENSNFLQLQRSCRPQNDALYERLERQLIGITLDRPIKILLLSLNISYMGVSSNDIKAGRRRERGRTTKKTNIDPMTMIFQFSHSPLVPPLTRLSNFRWHVKIVFLQS